MEALEQQYYSQCLQTLIESIELLLDEALETGENESTEFDVTTLLRMDSERRMKTLGESVKNTLSRPMRPVNVRTRRPLPVVMHCIFSSRTTVWRRCPVVMPVRTRSRRPGKQFQHNCLTAHLTVIRQSVKQSMMQ
ncbi:hypothetical protein [Escherichia coli]|uniref:hypothetical protein n=1 Tax=Escherichia coli TaxID=562 RepID=UPI002228432A|nr:hypothetical protein [Escherichia coli]MCW3371919.1 hypothetical protein [Escherichia coli]